MQVKVDERRREYDGFFKLDTVALRFEQFDGSMSERVSRTIFERGDSAAVLLYDPRRDVVVLVEQFRYPAYLREGGDGRLLEIVAGIIGGDGSPEAVARAELLEEAGYAVDKLEYVSRFYPSPGACTERIFLYLGYVSSAGRVGPGGGTAESGEDIRVHEISLGKALQLVKDGGIRDAKTIIALQYLALRGRQHEGEPGAANAG